MATRTTVQQVIGVAHFWSEHQINDLPILEQAARLVGIPESLTIGPALSRPVVTLLHRPARRLVRPWLT